MGHGCSHAEVRKRKGPDEPALCAQPVSD
jgi:hypothetical protein